jgi:branched-chain amino acid transport system substrate-binding protein
VIACVRLWQPLAVLVALPAMLAIAFAMCTSRLDAAEPYDVPVLISLTGPFAFLGLKEAQTLKAVETVANATGGIGGRPLHFVINDIQSNPVVAVQLVAPILASKAPAIIGPEPGAAVLAIEPLVKQDAVLYVLAASIHPKPGSYTFSNETSTDILLYAGTRYLHARGWNKIGMIASTDATGNDQIDQVTLATHAPGMGPAAIVGVERFATSDISVVSQLSRLKAAGADAVFVGTTGTGFGTVLHGISEIGWDVPVMTNAGNIIREQIEQYKSFLPKQVYFTGARFMSHSIARSGPVRNAQTVFYNALRAQGVTRPDFGSAVVWDPAWVVISGLRKLGPSASAEQLHDYIETLHGFPGINGIMDYRDGSQRGLGLNASLIVRWDAAKDDWVPVSEPGGLPLK